MKVADLIEHGLVVPGDELEWVRPKKGTSYRATVTASGAILIESGSAFSSPSRAAMEAAGVASYDGWYAWTVTRLDRTLNDLRHDLHSLLADGSPESGEVL
jgi:hypothetical protein